MTNFMISTMEDKARKNDRVDDKTRWELIPLDCLEDIARVYTEGAKKYGDNNWQNLENGYERYKGALLRHLYAAESETFDEETGCRHLAQVAWNSIALLFLSKNNEKNNVFNYSIPGQEVIEEFTEENLGKCKDEKLFNLQGISYELHTETIKDDSQNQKRVNSSFANSSNEELEEIFHKLVKDEEVNTYHHDNRTETGSNTLESGNNSKVSETDIEGHKS